jgi:molecular chaperone DnaJ
VANPDLYAVLEVEPTASLEELKRAYRRLARKYHPDSNSGDATSEAHFKEVSQAYEILSDSERRANYDRFGSDSGAGGNPFGANSVQDIFDMFFGGMGGHGTPRRGPQPGPDAEISLDITLDDAAFGASHEVTVAPLATGRAARPGPRRPRASSAPAPARSAACEIRSWARW